MTCTPSWKQQMHVELDGELDSSQQARLHHHIATCPACSEAWNELNWVVLSVRGLTEPADARPVAADLTLVRDDRERSPAATRAASGASNGISKLWRGAAAALLLGAILWWVPSVTKTDPEELQLTQRSESSKAEEASSSSEKLAPSIDETSPVQVLTAAPGLIVVPIRNEDPGVQIVWVYQADPRKVGTP